MRLFPRIRDRFERRVAENRVSDIAADVYREGMSLEEFRSAVYLAVDDNGLKGIIKQVLGELLDALIDYLFSLLGGGA